MHELRAWNLPMIPQRAVGQMAALPGRWERSRLRCCEDEAHSLAGPTLRPRERRSTASQAAGEPQPAATRASSQTKRAMAAAPPAHSCCGPRRRSRTMPAHPTRFARRRCRQHLRSAEPCSAARRRNCDCCRSHTNRPRSGAERLPRSRRRVRSRRLALVGHVDASARPQCTLVDPSAGPRHCSLRSGAHLVQAVRPRRPARRLRTAL